MSLESLYYLTQIIAVGLILVSLGFVGLQLRQSNRLARADMTQRAIDRFIPPMEIMVQDPDLAAHYSRVLRGETPSSDAIKARLNWFFTMMLQAHVGGWTIEQENLVDERTVDARANTIVRMLAAPHFKAEWIRTKRRGTFPLTYTNYVDRLVAQQSKTDTKPETAEPPSPT
ncbi:MAG: hypothetical protein AAGL11_09105 [Pseudomonadota bacterium]